MRIDINERVGCLEQNGEYYMTFPGFVGKVTGDNIRNIIKYSDDKFPRLKSINEEVNSVMPYLEVKDELNKHYNFILLGSRIISIFMDNKISHFAHELDTLVIKEDYKLECLDKDDYLCTMLYGDWNHLVRINTQPKDGFKRSSSF